MSETLPRLMDRKQIAAELGEEQAAVVWEWLPKLWSEYVLERDLRTYLADFTDEGEPASVYQAHDGDGQLLYVGVTSKRIGRFRDHSRDSKWWSEAASISLEHFPNRKSALRREAELIAERRPPFNKAAGQTRYTRDRYRLALLERSQ